MKKLFLAIALVLTATSVFAGDTNNKNQAILNDFKNTFAGASNVQMTSKANYVEVSFTENGEQGSAYYSFSGEFVGTSKAIAIDALPTGAKRTFAKKYDGYTVKEAMQFDGVAESAYFISAENDRESVILKASTGGFLSVVRKVKKS